MPEGFDSLHERPVRVRFQVVCDANRLRMDFASRRQHTFAKPDNLLHAYRQSDGGRMQISATRVGWF
jgi:hypothetical protein